MMLVQLRDIRVKAVERHEKDQTLIKYNKNLWESEVENNKKNPVDRTEKELCDQLQKV